MRAVLPSIPPVAEATATIGEGSCILALKEREVAEHTP